MAREDNNTTSTMMHLNSFHNHASVTQTEPLGSSAHECSPLHFSKTPLFPVWMPRLFAWNKVFFFVFIACKCRDLTFVSTCSTHRYFRMYSSWFILSQLSPRTTRRPPSKREAFVGQLIWPQLLTHPKIPQHPVLELLSLCTVLNCILRCHKCRIAKEQKYE